MPVYLAHGQHLSFPLLLKFLNGRDAVDHWSASVAAAMRNLLHGLLASGEHVDVLVCVLTSPGPHEHLWPGSKGGNTRGMRG